MAALNRIKVVLVEQKKTGNGQTKMPNLPVFLILIKCISIVYPPIF